MGKYRGSVSFCMIIAYLFNFCSNKGTISFPQLQFLCYEVCRRWLHHTWHQLVLWEGVHMNFIMLLRTCGFLIRCFPVSIFHLISVPIGCSPSPAYLLVAASALRPNNWPWMLTSVQMRKNPPSTLPVLPMEAPSADTRVPPVPAVTPARPRSMLSRRRNSRRGGIAI